VSIREARTDPAFAASFDFPTLVQDVEDATPADIVLVVGRYVANVFPGAVTTFWVADYSGHSLERLDHARPREAVDVASSAAGRALRTQDASVEPAGEGFAVFVPVTVRGEAVGVLELRLRERPGDDDVRHVRQLGHAFGYLVAGTRRHTDLFEWGQRSRDLNVAAEIQRRLLPAFTCESWPMTVAGWVEPAFEAGGDTFDYTVDDASTTVTLTDAMGHGISAALVASLTLGVLRNSRRRSASMAEQVAAANLTLFERSRDDEYVTGVFVEVPADGGPAKIISAGHPPPWRVRGGKTSVLDVEQGIPIGMFADSVYTPSVLDLRATDRLVLVSDGVVDTLERSGVTMVELLDASAELHPREVVQLLTSTVVEMQRGEPRDDATAVCIDWHGGDPGRDSSSGADRGEASPALEAVRRPSG
jgi:serine phosphatase RsbU (regulator of sigma subunit)